MTFLDQLHSVVIRSIWLQRFTVFNRVVLAAAFLPSGMKKVMGERFTQIPVDHPVGFFFEAMYRTGFYYNFLGWMQVITAILLLIPRTSTLGAVVFFPIVLNICLITISLQFQGTWVITSLMVLANLYLLCWDYDKLKFILPFEQQRVNVPAKRVRHKLDAFDWVETAVWSVIGTIGVSGMLMINPFFTIPSRLFLIVAAVIGGIIFGFFAVWHRRKLTIVENCA